MKILNSLKSILWFALMAGIAFGQQTGTGTFGASDSFVDLATLTPYADIPIITKPGAIPFNYSLRLLSACHVNGVAGATSLSCGPGYAMSTTALVSTSAMVGMKLVSSLAQTQGTCTTYSQFALIEASGTVHSLAKSDSWMLCGTTGSGGFTDVTKDNSGYTVVASGSAGTFTVWDRSGRRSNATTLTNTVAVGSEMDPFGNSLSLSSGVYTDTLAAPALVAVSSPHPGWQWIDTTGANQQFYEEAQPSKSVNINLGCVANPTIQGTQSSYNYTYPDGTFIQVGLEQGSGGVGTTTGRMGSITLRTGGQITYSYGSLVCIGTAPAETVIPSSLSVSTPDGTTSYTWSTNNSQNTVTRLDPGKNKTVYTFSQLSDLPTLTEMQSYQNIGTVSAPSYTLLETDLYCYNGNLTSCPTATITYPITERDVLRALGSMGVNSRVKKLFDSYGNITETDSYDFGASTPTYKTPITYGSWNGSSCVALGSGIVNKPCRVQTTDNAGHVISDATYSYLSNGFLSGENHWSGSAWITTMTASANGNGTVHQLYNSLGTPTTYNYAATGSGGCNTLLPTHTSTLVGTANLTTDATWDCNMGKLMSSTDEDSNTANFTYDLLGRPLSQSYPASATIGETYPSAVESTVGNTFTTTTRTVDGYGLNPLVQTTDGASYDTSSTGQGFNGLVYYQFNTSQPCIAALNAGCTINHFARLDPLGRQFYESTTGNETVTTVYYGDATHSVFDVQTTVSPAPSGEHTKVAQTEYDGLGRVKSTCVIQTTGGTSCGQAMGGSGIKTSFTYTYAAGQTTVAATRGSQAHTTVYDAMGRVKSVATPEAGTTTYIYDQASASCSSGSAPGFLMEIVDNAGVHTCQGYDPIGRPTNTFVAGTSNPCRVLVYGDQSGLSVTNGDNKVVEAWTDSDCSGASKITDEQFSYDPAGRTIDVWESTPHSAGQYHSTATYALNGQLTSLSGVASAYTVVLDSNGRPYTSKYGTTVVGNGTTYNAAGQATEIDTGTGSDKDVYTYDANTGLMKTWAFTINSISENATLTWNANRTLKTLAITDGFNSGGTHTCRYNPTDAAGTGYDDVGRLVGVNCGTPWTQTYTYDQYNNFSKSGTTNWNPGYNSTLTCPTGTICNHITGAGYDSDGQVTYDLNNSYAWDSYHKMITANAGASLGSCGSAGVTCVTYDAFGRPIEKNVGGTITEMLYSPIGLTGIMNGQIANNFRVRIPGGAIFDGSVTNGNLVSHVDWLGSARVEYSLGHACKLDTAYSPYGEKYANFCNAGYVTFTGDYQNLYSGLYDTPNREFDTSSGSRWISPDPARASWNAYSYPTNPNGTIDPSGLQDEAAQGGRDNAELPDSPGTACQDWGCGDQGLISRNRTIQIDLVYHAPWAPIEPMFNGGFMRGGSDNAGKMLVQGIIAGGYGLNKALLWLHDHVCSTGPTGCVGPNEMGSMEGSELAAYAEKWAAPRRSPNFSGGNAGVGGEVNPAQLAGLHRGVDPWIIRNGPGLVDGAMNGWRSPWMSYPWDTPKGIVQSIDGVEGFRTAEELAPNEQEALDIQYNIKALSRKNRGLFLVGGPD